MTTKTVKGKDLKPGDKLIRADGKVITIREFTNGFYLNSRLAHYGRGADDWTTVFNNGKYEVVNADTHSTAPVEK